MRLYGRIKHCVTVSIKNAFGDIDIYLFGSRVDDTKRGGDIDIAVDIDMTNEQFRKAQVEFLLSMMRYGLEDLKVDLVSYNTKDKLLYDEIHNNCIRLQES